MRFATAPFVVLISSFFLWGCAEFNPRSLAPVDIKSTLILREPFVYEHDFALRSGAPATVWLVSGAYEAKFKDENGKYYFGPPMCHQVLDLVGKVHIRDACGLFVPNDVNRPVEIFHLKGMRVATQLDPKLQAVTSDSGKFALDMIHTNPQMYGSPIDAGVGASLATGIIVAIEEQRKGNIFFGDVLKPDGMMLRAALAKPGS